jgi:hypothetical protein
MNNFSCHVRLPYIQYNLASILLYNIHCLLFELFHCEERITLRLPPHNLLDKIIMPLTLVATLVPMCTRDSVN